MIHLALLAFAIAVGSIASYIIHGHPFAKKGFLVIAYILFILELLYTVVWIIAMMGMQK